MVSYSNEYNSFYCYSYIDLPKQTFIHTTINNVTWYV